MIKKLLLNIIQANAIVSEASLHEEEDECNVEEHEGEIPRLEVENQENIDKDDRHSKVTYSFI